MLIHTQTNHTHTYIWLFIPFHTELGVTTDKCMWSNRPFLGPLHISSGIHVLTHVHTYRHAHCCGVYQVPAMTTTILLNTALWNFYHSCDANLMRLSLLAKTIYMYIHVRDSKCGLYLAKEKTVSHVWWDSTWQLQRNANQLSNYIEILCILVCFPDHTMCG